jgi:hypothetical protein
MTLERISSRTEFFTAGLSSWADALARVKILVVQFHPIDLDPVAILGNTGPRSVCSDLRSPDSDDSSMDFIPNSAPFIGHSQGIVVSASITRSLARIPLGMAPLSGMSTSVPWEELSLSPTHRPS